MTEPSQMLTLRAECTLSDSPERAKGGVPLKKGTGPLRFAFGGETYTCKIAGDEGPIEIGETGELIISVLVIDSAINVKVNDHFRLVPRPGTIYAEGRVTKIIEDKREIV